VHFARSLTILAVWAALTTWGALADAQAGGAGGSSDTSARQPTDTAARVRADTAPTVSFGGFVDTYYAYDVDRPRDFDRAFTTQPARHDEFNVNLAFLEVKVTGQRYHGRLALQFGTSVQANYFAEPRLGVVSGPSVSQYIQEASIGYRLTSTLWVDGGIYPAHTGYEGWISRDNLTYTRSLVADYSPYYEAGVKLTWTPSSAVTAQLHVLNGWQDISNYNSPQALGARIDFTASSKVTLSYDDFVGNMAPDSLRARIRFFNDFIAQYTPSSRWQLAAVFDIGTQGRTASDDGTATWYGTSAIAKYHVTPRVGIVGRLERYADPSQVVVSTALPVAFKTSGASLGVDVAPVARVLWRTEVRGFRSDNAVWAEHRVGTYARTDAVAVTSLALTF
jgi:hypothetical protein